MHPWILENPPISTYGVCIVVGLLFAWLRARRNARAAGFDASRIDVLVPLLMAAGLAGAWALGAVSAEGGHVLFGSLLLATAAGIGYAILTGIPLGVLGDICAAPVALGIAWGRLGCFFAGCCYGKVCDGLPGLRFPVGSFAWRSQVASGLLSDAATESLTVYPVQLMEAGACVVLAAVLAIAFRYRRVSGEGFLWLGIGYGVIRFGMEFLRADNLPVGGLTMSQWICMGVAVVCVGTMVVRRRWADAMGLRVARAGMD